MSSSLKTVSGEHPRHSPPNASESSFSRPLRCRTCYIGTVLYIIGFVVLGASFQKHLSVGALVIGWGIAEVAVMINTTAICESPQPSARLERGETLTKEFQTRTATTASRACRARSRG